jgi:hypothetical protein
MAGTSYNSRNACANVGLLETCRVRRIGGLWRALGRCTFGAQVQRLKTTARELGQEMQEHRKPPPRNILQAPGNPRLSNR